jgi:hypothetical protein
MQYLLFCAWLISLNKMFSSFIDITVTNRISFFYSKYEALSSNPVPQKKKTFSLRSGIRQRFPFLSLLFHIILEVLGRAIRKEKALNGIGLHRKKSSCPCL